MKPVSSLYPSEEWERIQSEYVKDVGIKRRIETRVVRKDRRLIDVDLSVNVIKNSDGKNLGATEILSDISAKKNVEQNLEQHRELLQSLMDNIPDSVYFKDDKSRFVLVNKAKAVHWNTTPGDMVGKTDFDFLSEEDARRVCEDDSRVMRTGEPIVSKVERLTAGDGSEKWVSVTKMPRYNKIGQIIGTMGISRDITEWKKMEEKSTKNLELLQMLMDNIPDSIYFKDEQNRFILVNKAKADHWNTKTEDMIGKTDFDFLPHEQAQKAFDDDNRIMQTKKPIVDEIEKIKGSDGLERWFSVTKIPRYNKEGKVIGTLGISRNVTEWKKLKDMKMEKLK